MQSVLMIKELEQLRSKDADTYEHSLRVAAIAGKAASRLNYDERQKYQLVNGCLLHDIGKLYVPDEILQKSSALTASEWNIMKKHTTLGAMIIRDYPRIDEEIIETIEFHHERWDGKGYPMGLRKKEIPVYARICAILDAYDCMVSDRPYRPGMPDAEAKKQLLQHAGSQFDPSYVQFVLELLEK
ncbi:HD-GYP domain-containing protein [Paenibacillus cymbidii]|uniref:HD-GYP domain-containing protein n=1 Tax=Paenibacillus cymbidii TaxID=1639034 RepID=UPI001F451C13|nr:HD-GYP domain-containing protein [Paenibacillus cymbidii]